MNPSTSPATPRPGSASAGGQDLLVVVPAKDAAATLPACLAAVFASVPPPAAVVVVDDGSRDETAAVAAAAGARVLSPVAAPTGPGVARDLAVQETAAGALVAVVDADVVVRPDALARLASEIGDDPAVVAAFGSYDDRPPAPSVAARYANLRHHLTHQRAGGEAATFWAGLGAVRRSAWTNAGGFGRRYARPAIEDIDFGRRLIRAGGRIRCVPEAQGTHLKAWTLRQLWRTDVLQRALPWSRLLLQEEPVAVTAPPGERSGSALNTGRRDQLSALAVHGVWLFALLAWLLTPPLALASVACVAGWIGLNAGLLRLLWRVGGLRLGVGGGLLHALHHGYASLAFGWVLVETRWAAARGGLAARAAAAVAFIGAGLAAGGLLAAAAAPTSGLASLLGRLGDAGGPLSSLSSAAPAFQTRAALLGLTAAAVAGVVVLAGPGPWAAIGRDLRPTLARLLRPLRPPPIAWLLAGLTLLLGVGLMVHLSQPLRADEGQTFLRSGLASPLHAALLWTSPNHHVLHSVLMRFSILCFGTGLGAIRLPVVLITLACVPLVFLGLRPHLGRAAALGACGLFAGSAYALETGTNARGYPVVLGATLLLAALARPVRAGRPAAITLAAIAAAVGAWAVPVMLFSFACFVAWLLLAGRRHPRRTLAITAGVVAGTGVLTIGLYGPSLLLLPPSGTGAGMAVRDAVTPLTLAERAATLGRNTGGAWEQFAFPLRGTAARVAAAWVLLGFLTACLRGQRDCRLVLAIVLGTAATLAALGVPPMPWWTMGAAFPFLLGLACLPLAVVWSAAQRERGGPTRSLTAAAGLAGAAAMAAWAGGYPERFPRVVGYRDAPLAAAVVEELLAEPQADPLFVDPGVLRRAAFAYHLFQRRVEVGVAASLSPEILPGEQAAGRNGGVARGHRLLRVRMAGEAAGGENPLPPGVEGTPSRRWRLPMSELVLYEPSQGDSPSGDNP